VGTGGMELEGIQYGYLENGTGRPLVLVTGHVEQGGFSV